MLLPISDLCELNIFGHHLLYIAAKLREIASHVTHCIAAWIGGEGTGNGDINTAASAVRCYIEVKKNCILVNMFTFT